MFDIEKFAYFDPSDQRYYATTFWIDLIALFDETNAQALNAEHKGKIPLDVMVEYTQAHLLRKKDQRWALENFSDLPAANKNKLKALLNDAGQTEAQLFSGKIDTVAFLGTSTANLFKRAIFLFEAISEGQAEVESVLILGTNEPYEGFIENIRKAITLYAHYFTENTLASLPDKISMHELMLFILDHFAWPSLKKPALIARCLPQGSNTSDEANQVRLLLEEDPKKQKITVLSHQPFNSRQAFTVLGALSKSEKACSLSVAGPGTHTYEAFNTFPASLLSPPLIVDNVSRFLYEINRNKWLLNHQENLLSAYFNTKEDHELLINDCVEVACKLELALDKLVELPTAFAKDPGFRRAYALMVVVQYMRTKTISTELASWCHSTETACHEAFSALTKDSKSFVKNTTMSAYHAGLPGGFLKQEETDLDDKIRNVMGKQAFQFKIIYRAENSMFYALLSQENLIDEIQDTIAVKREKTAAAMNAPHITLNEGMKKEEGLRCFENLKAALGEPKPITVAGTTGNYLVFESSEYSAHLSPAAKAYSGQNFANTAQVKVFCLPMSSTAFTELAQYGIRPKVSDDYKHHMTFYTPRRKELTVPNHWSKMPAEVLCTAPGLKELLEQQRKLSAPPQGLSVFANTSITTPSTEQVASIKPQM